MLPLGADAKPLTLTEEQASFAKSCHHYENRSRFDARGTNQSFVATLADNCEAALATLSSASEGATAARDYLLRLTELKNAVVRLQVRAFQASRETEHPEGRYVRVLTSISETGEYLIAREIGVLDSLNAWTATQSEQSPVAKAALK